MKCHQLGTNEFYDPILKKNVSINYCIELRCSKNVYNSYNIYSLTEWFVQCNKFIDPLTNKFFNNSNINRIITFLKNNNLLSLNQQKSISQINNHNKSKVTKQILYVLSLNLNIYKSLDNESNIFINEINTNQTYLSLIKALNKELSLDTNTKNKMLSLYKEFNSIA